jgi:hypothetical protein
MSFVEDLRKLLKEIVTPDLKALEAKVAALDKKIDLRSDALDDKIDLTRDPLLAEIKAVMAMLIETRASVERSLDLDRHLSRIESERPIPVREQALERTA